MSLLKRMKEIIEKIGDLKGKRVIILTHTDLDGEGCALLVKEAFPDAEIIYSDINYDDVTENVSKILSEKEFDILIISDLAISNPKEDSTFKCVNLINSSNKNVILLDHHDYSIELKDYSWNLSSDNYEDEPTSGTELVYLFLTQCGFKFNKFTEYLVEKINRYDTWLWAKKYNDTICKQLNDLFYIYGRERFHAQFLEKIYNNPIDLFDTTDNLLLELEQDKINSYIESKSSNFQTIVIDGIQGAVVFATEYINELAHTILEKNESIGFVAIVKNMKSVSLRGMSKEGVNITEIASKFGGGGKLDTGGFKIKKDFKSNIIKQLFEQ